MARKYLRNDELLERIDNNDEYEIGDEDKSYSVDNVEKQIEIPNELEMESNSVIKTYRSSLNHFII